MADKVGQQIGNYRLVRLLGSGGFADVYLGQHIHLASKQAAIKILHLTDVDVQKFQQEAEITEQLVHPHIVRLLDFALEQGTPFLVLDFAPGGSLRTRHPKGSQVPIDTVVGYLKEITPALQYAHDRNILHRDIKPENMLIGRQGELLISDFGIAVLSQTGRTSLQASYGIGGTPFYMAPEQYRGKPEKASDQYSLAVVVYEWLCGTGPFSEGGFIQLGYQHTHEPVPPPREKNPNLYSNVEAVILTALAKDPHQRFGSVRAFATALEQASQVSANATATTPPSWPLQPADMMTSLSQPQQGANVAPLTESTGTVTTSDPSSQPSVPLGVPQYRSFAAARSMDKLQTPHRNIFWRAIVLGLIGLVIAASIGFFHFTAPNLILSPKATASSSPMPSPTPSATLTACQRAFSDEFNGSLDARWDWINPRKDSTHSVTDRLGYLRISTPDGHDLFPGNNYDAPRLLQLIDGDFTVTTLVEFDPHYQYQGAGLLIWQDANNFLRLERSYGDFASSVSGIHLDQDENGVYSDIAPTSQHPTTAARVELRVQRSGDHFTASWRIPGNAWQVVGETVIHLGGVKVGLDLIAQHGAPQTTADYDYFRVSCN